MLYQESYSIGQSAVNLSVSQSVNMFQTKPEVGRDFTETVLVIDPFLTSWKINIDPGHDDEPSVN